MRWIVFIVAFLCVSLILTAFASQKQDMSSLVEQLGDEDASVRDNAVKALGGIGELAVPVLIQALSDDNPFVRLEATRVLGGIGKPAEHAVPALEKLLRDENVTIRIMAADALCNIDNSRGDTVIPVLMQALGDEDIVIRHDAVSALARIGANTEAAVPALIVAFEDENSSVRAEAAEALARIGVPALPALIQALDNESSLVRGTAAYALGGIGEPAKGAVPALADALRDERTEGTYTVSFRAAVALVKIGQPAVPALIQALVDPSSLARANAAYALGEVGYASGGIGELAEEALPALIEMLRDKDKEARGRAAYALGGIGEPAIPALIEALNHEDRDVRSNAAYALGRIGEPAKDAVPVLMKAMSNDDYVRLGAAEALGKIGEPAVPALVEALNHEDEDVRRNAASVLGKIGELPKGAVPALIKRLGDEDLYVRYNATIALSRIGEPAVPALIEALRSEDSAIRSSAAYVLGDIGEPTKDAVVELIEALRDQEGVVRRNAMLSLSKIGKPAVPMLMETLKHEDQLVSSSAAYVLKQINTPEATKAVEGSNSLYTPPTKWDRFAYYGPFDEEFADKVRLWFSVLPSDLKGQVFSLNNVYWYIPIFPDTTKMGPWSTIIQVYNGRDYVIQLFFVDHRYQPKITWIHEKLLYIEVWWGRMMGSEFILDVERELFIYKEMVQSDQIAVDQWNQQIKFYLNRLKHEDISLRRDAACALGNIVTEAIHLFHHSAAEDAVSALIEALKDEDEGVRVSAAEALKMIGTSEALEAVASFETEDKQK